MAWLERQHAVKAHARRAAPDDDVTMFQQDALGCIGALQAAEQKDALEAERDGDDGLGHIALVAVLMNAEFDACLVAVDVAGIWTK